MSHLSRTLSTFLWLSRFRMNSSDFFECRGCSEFSWFFEGLAFLEFLWIFRMSQCAPKSPWLFFSTYPVFPVSNVQHDREAIRNFRVSHVAHWFWVQIPCEFHMRCIWIPSAFRIRQTSKKTAPPNGKFRGTLNASLSGILRAWRAQVLHKKKQNAPPKLYSGGLEKVCWRLMCGSRFHTNSHCF